MESVVAESGQVLIPEELRKKLGITSQTILDFREEDGKLVAVKVLHDDPVSRARGCISLGMSTDEFINMLRGEP
jgi:AbrB family looped-hinge helix DNA binding protein